MRTPPAELGVERAILGAALYEADAAAIVAGLDPTLFWLGWHQDVLAGIGRLLAKGVPVDAPTLRVDLESAKTSVAPGEWPAKLAQLLEEATVTPSLGHYLEKLRDYALRRNLIHAGREAVEACYDLTVPIAEVLDRHTDECVRLGLGGQADPTLTPAQFAAEVRQGRDPQRIETGWHGLDTLLGGGLTVGNMHLLAGRPGNGKTAMVLQIFNFLTSTLGVPGLFVSLDMSRAEIGRRWLRHGTIEDLARSGFYIADPIAPTAASVVAMVRRAVVQYGIQIAAVDHVGKVLPDRQCERREQEVGETAVTFRNAARALDLPLLVLSQMNRAMEQRESKRPVLSDLRDSGQLEQEAATVMFLWRKRAKEETNQDVIVTVEKNRDGPTGDVPMTFKRDEGRLLA